jgi:hypothetical protein
LYIYDLATYWIDTDAPHDPVLEIPLAGAQGGQRRSRFDDQYRLHPDTAVLLTCESGRKGINLTGFIPSCSEQFFLFLLDLANTQSEVAS